MSQPTARRRSRGAPRSRRRSPAGSARLELGPGGFPFPLLTWTGVDVTVQLLPSLLAEGRIPRFAVGDVVEAAPAISLRSCLPCYVGADRWGTDEHGLLRARGTILGSRPTVRACGPRLLEVAGEAYPVDGVLVDEVGLDRVDVEGALYLEPEPAPGAEFGGAVALCRRRWRVGAIRRYRRTAAAPDFPVPIHRVPAPEKVSEESVYVADLVPVLRDAGPA